MKKYRMGDDCSALIPQVLNERGWSLYEPPSNKSEDIWNIPEVDGWQLYWKLGRFNEEILRELKSFQRINHFPSCKALVNKDHLCRHIRRSIVTFGAIYKFHPMSFLVPKELKEFQNEYKTREEKKENNIWICKPSALSRGRDIYMLTNIDKLIYDQAYVVQEYIERPLLVDGYKFDMRIYVLVTSWKPLHAFIYQKGLIRFSTQQYNLSDTDNLFSHLTNASINKESPTLDSDKGLIGIGAKWTLDRFMSWYENRGNDSELLWSRIVEIATLTVLAAVHEVKHCAGSFELLGFDILLDEKCKPWLLEVNLSPSMGAKCDEDNAVKIPLLNDLLESIGLGHYDYVTDDHIPSVGSSKSQSKFGKKRYKKVNDNLKQNEITTSSSTNKLKRGFSSSHLDNSYDSEKSSVGMFQRIFPFDDSTQALNDKFSNLEAEPTGMEVTNFKRLAVKAIKRLRSKRIKKSRQSSKSKK